MYLRHIRSMNCIGDSEQCSTWNQPFLGDEHAVLWSAMKPADGRFGPIVTCHVLLDGATVEAVKGFLTEKPETTMGDLITFGQSRLAFQNKRGLMTSVPRLHQTLI